MRSPDLFSTTAAEGRAKISEGRVQQTGRSSARHLCAGRQAHGAPDREAAELRGRRRPPNRRRLMLRLVRVLRVLLRVLLRVQPQLHGGVVGGIHWCLAIIQGTGQRPPRLGDRDDRLLATARRQGHD